MNDLTQSLEDYLEAIWIEGRRNKVVRVKDIVLHLGVKAASVVEAMNNLGEKGLVSHERYGYIELTLRGKKIAEEIYQKHEILYRFLNEILGVEKQIAADDACKIEHHINKKTFEKIIKFIEFIDSYPEGEPNWLSKFRRFAKKNTC